MNGASDLTSVLSASSYPLPEPFIPRTRSDGEEGLSLYGGLQLETPPDDQQTDQATSSKSSKSIMQRLPEGQPHKLSASAESPPKKRGRPRQTPSGPMSGTPGERRRTQIRLAQRAYRSRKEVTLSNRQTRIAQLETVVEKMGMAILSFSEELVRAGVLESHPSIMPHLHDTVKTCVSLAEEAGPDSKAKIDSQSPRSEAPLSPLAEPGRNNPSATLLFRRADVPRNSTVVHGGPQALSSISSPLIFNPANISHVELSAFIKLLRGACVDYGYSALRNPSANSDKLRRKFRFLLSTMSRERLASYFGASLQAQAGQRHLEEWKDIPFFSLGGAGTHYPRPSSPSSRTGRPFHPHQKWGQIWDPLSPFSPEIQEQMDGEWFDIQDLEGFLVERDIHLLRCPPKETREPGHGLRKETAINISSLMQVLVSQSVCLGRSPGWRRRDVEEALRTAVWA